MSSQFPVLRTSDLILRELTPKDADTLFTLYSNLSDTQWSGVDTMTQRTDAHAFIATHVDADVAVRPDIGIRWGISKLNNDKLLGTCGLIKFNTEWHSCLMVCDLLPQARGHGHMQEALRTMISWGITHLGLHRMEAQIQPNNHAAIRLAEKLGFSREGLSRKAGYWNQQYHDLCLFGLLTSEFYE